MSSPVVARIDLPALRHNLSCVRRAAPDSRLMAVIKANAYGHGMRQVARALRGGADAFAVARCAEAMELRADGLASPIVLLSGFADPAELELCSLERLQPVVHDPTQIRMLERARLQRPVRIWLKVDTGMHRLGLSVEQAPGALQLLSKLASVARPLRLMTHFAAADDLEDGYTRTQLRRFRGLIGTGLAKEFSAANSAAVLAHPDSHLDWVRPGIMLYGASPFMGGVAEADGLRGAMTLETRLIAVKDLAAGEPVGYGCTWRAPFDTRLGVAAIGYGDGYPRHLPSGTPVLVNGRRVSLVGRVSMDLITIDLENDPDARVGDRVVLWGEGLAVEEVARAAGTIPYELVTRLGSRVRREYAGR